MFSSPLPYKRADEQPCSSSRYAEALPPPVPASPLRNPPPPPQPVHANTYYPPPSHPHAPPPPPLNHAYTAPAGWTRTSSQPQEHGWTGMDPAWSSSRPVLIDRHSELLQTEQMPTSRGVEVGEESEASKLVRMMSRSRSRPLSQAPTTAAVPSFPIQNDGRPPPQAQSISCIQQLFEPNSGVFPLTLSPNEADNGAGYFQPTQYQPYQPDQQQQQQQHSTYSNTYGNTNTRPDVELFQINSSSITTTTRRRYPLSPFPEQEVDSRTVSGSATPLPPYAVYPQSQPSSSFQAPPPQQQQQHVQTERQHGFHLAGDVKIPASTSSGAHSSPPPTLTPPTAMTANNAETPKGEEYHVLPSSSSHNNNNNNNNNHRSSTNSRTHNPNINPNDPKPPHHHHHHHGKNKNSTGTGTWTGTGTCAGIVLGGMTMPNAQEYASIPSYGASSSLTSDDSSYYSSSNSESEDSDSAPEADEAGSGRQVDSARERRERERDREGRPSGPEWEANEEDQRRQRQWERERHDSFPSLHSQLDDDDAHRQQAQQTDLQAQSQPTSQPAVSQLERAGSIAAASIHSFKAGDEVGLLASNPAEREQQAKLNETAGLLGKEQASDAVLGVSAGEDRVYSYHPPPADLPAKATSEQPSEIPLFCAPTSFQLLGQSLKRLLADLMVSASTSFVPAPSAYASSCAETPVWRVEVWVRTFTLPVPPVAGALVVGKRVGGGAKYQGKRWMVGGGYRTMVGIELDEQLVRPSLAMVTSRSSGVGGTALALTRTRSSRYSHSGVTDNEQQQQQIAGSTLPAKPAATSSDSTNTLLPTFTASHVLRLRLPIPLQTPFTAAELVETLHKHYQYGKRVGRSTTTSLAAGSVEENAYSFARMVDRAPGPVDEVARLSKAHKLGRTAFWDGRAVPTVATPDERAGEDIQGQVGRKGFRYTMRKAVSKAVGAVQGEREDTVEDDRANWVTPFTG